MKKVLPFLLLYVLFNGCKPEADVKPANANTFVRYFGSEYSHDAQLALEAFEGYTLLSTVNIPTDGLGNYIFKIRFIHTDIYGNIVWHKEYPSFDEVDVIDVQENGAPTGGFKASSFIALESGYLIVGDRINGSGSSDLVLIETDKNGEQVNIRFMSPGASSTPESLYGHAVMADETSYVVLGSIESPGTNSQMFLTKLSSNYDSLWSYRYVDGENKLMNRLFYSADKTELVWASSVTLTNGNTQSDLRLIRTPEDSQGTNSGNAFGEPSLNEIGSDVCKSIGGYAIVGTSQSNAGGAEDILLSLVSSDGTPRGEPQNFSFNTQEDVNDEGNSINQTSEGGLVILGTVESGSIGNGRKDLYLIKTDANGNQQWSNNFGGPEDEQGASAFETSDGSYLIFGTTAFGSLKKLILIKTNNKGQL